MKAIISKQKPIGIVADKQHAGMYRLQWRDGSLSCKYYDPEDPMDDGGPNSYGMYSLTRAKDILKNYNEYARVMKLAKESPFATSIHRSDLLRAKTVTGEFSVSQASAVP